MLTNCLGEFLLHFLTENVVTLILSKHDPLRLTLSPHTQLTSKVILTEVHEVDT